MARHLISATLTPEAYAWYEQWSKERKGSEKISEAIVAHGSQFHQSDMIIEWRKTRLVSLVRRMLEQIPESRMKNISEVDRASIDQLARPSREYSRYSLGVEEE